MHPRAGKDACFFFFFATFTQTQAYVAARNGIVRSVQLPDVTLKLGLTVSCSNMLLMILWRSFDIGSGRTLTDINENYS